MPKKTKAFTANSGADVETVVQGYLATKNLAQYITFIYDAFGPLKGPVSINLALDYTIGIGGTVKISATGSDGTQVNKTGKIVIPPKKNRKDLEDILANAGLV
jgi:hypothetical protein